MLEILVATVVLLSVLYSATTVFGVLILSILLHFQNETKYKALFNQHLLTYQQLLQAMQFNAEMQAIFGDPNDASPQNNDDDSDDDDDKPFN
jgi:hypothetical protein